MPFAFDLRDIQLTDRELDLLNEQYKQEKFAYEQRLEIKLEDHLERKLNTKFRAGEATLEDICLGLDLFTIGDSLHYLQAKADPYLEQSEHGFTKHKSFGGLSLNHVSSTVSNFVGSASMSRHYATLEIGHVKIYDKRDDFGHTMDRMLYNLNLADDQVVGLLEDLGQGVPCAITRSPLSVDLAPNLLQVDQIAKDLVAKANRITQPINDALVELKAFLHNEKISRKDDYQRLKSLADAVQMRIHEADAPLRAVFTEYADTMATAAVQQVMHEAPEEIKRIGVSVRALLQQHRL